MNEPDLQQEVAGEQEVSGSSGIKLFFEELRWYVRVHATLFIGAILTVGGVLSFESGRYCDGSTSDHFACTNPSTYYDYSLLTTILIVVGVCLILLWWLKQRDLS
jgi:hypothetical protein